MRASRTHAFTMVPFRFSDWVLCGAALVSAAATSPAAPPPPIAQAAPHHSSCDVTVQRASVAALVREANGDHEALKVSLGAHFESLVAPVMEAGCQFVRLTGAPTTATTSAANLAADALANSAVPARRLAMDSRIDVYKQHGASLPTVSLKQRREPLTSSEHGDASANGADTAFVTDDEFDYEEPPAATPSARSPVVTAPAATPVADEAGKDAGMPVATTRAATVDVQVAADVEDLELAAQAAARDLPHVAHESVSVAGAPRAAILLAQDRRERLDMHLNKYGAHLLTMWHYAAYLGYDILLYTRAAPLPFNVTGHFSKIPAAYGALYGLGYDYVLGTDWDAFIEPLTAVPIPALTHGFAKAGLFLQFEANLCSCALLYRRNDALRDILKDWWAMGSTGMFAGATLLPCH